MKHAVCTCAQEIKQDQLSLGRWVGCRNCGRDHGLVRPSGLLWCVVVGTLALGCGLFGAERIDAPAGLPDGWLLRYAAMGLAAVLGAISLAKAVRLIATFQGVPEERETVISRTLAEFQSGLAVVSLSSDATRAAKETLKHCRAAIKTLDEFAALPLQGYWSKAQAAATAAAAAYRLGKSREATELLAFVSEVPKSQPKAFWTAWYYAQTSDQSAAAVKAYLRFLNGKLPNADETIRNEIITALQRACESRVGGSAEQIKQSIRWNQEAGKVFPDDAWPRLNEATGWLKLEKYSRCLKALGDLATDTDNWRAQLILFQAEAGEGLRSRSQTRLEQLKTQATDNPDLALQLAQIFLLRNELAEAEPFLQMAKSSDAAVGHASVSLHAKFLLAQNRSDEACQLLEEALAEDAGNADMSILLAEILCSEGQAKKAEEVLWNAVKNNPNSPTVQAAWARHQFNAAEYADAADAFEQAVKQGASADDFALLRGRCLLNLGRHKDAAAVLDQAALVSAEDAMQISFYHGVAIYQQVQQNMGAGAARALPYFAKSARQARELGDRDVLTRSKINSLNCLRSIAEESFVAGKYAESGRAWEQLGKSLKPGHEAALRTASNAAEGYLRDALRLVTRNRPIDAVAPLEAAVRLRTTSVLRLILGTVYFAAGDYQKAQQTFSALLAENETDDRVRYYQALSAARNRSSEGREALQLLLQDSLRFRTRAALALADLAAEAQDFAAGAAVLKSVLMNDAGEVTELRRDRYFGECSCKLALFMVRMGNPEEAKSLIQRLLSDQADDSEKILGAILAEVGDYDSALNTLQKYVSQHRSDTAAQQLLSGLALRVALNHCEFADYHAAQEALKLGLCRTSEADYRQLHQLVMAACEDGTSVGGVSDQTLRILERCSQESNRMAAITSRPIFVGRLTEAHSYAKAANYEAAQKSAARAAVVWESKIRKSPAFWRHHIQTFNEGKEHQVESGGQQLAGRIQQRLIGFWLLGLQSCCHGEFRETGGLDLGLPDYEGITFFWQSLINFVGDSEAKKLAQKHLKPIEIAQKIGRSVSDDEAGRFAKFFRTAVFADPDLAIFALKAANKSIREAIANLDSAALRSGLNEFLALAPADLEDRKILTKVAALTNLQRDRIFTLMSSDTQLSTIKTISPDLHFNCCLSILIQFGASANGLRLSMITQLYDQVSADTIKQLLKG